MSRDLSPAAQAVLDAVEDDCIHPDGKHRLAAAALRAAADQVIPEQLSMAPADIRQNRLRHEFLAIAAQLESTP